MARVRFSRLAESDLAAIREFSIERWGKRQARQYLEMLEKCCTQLQKSPNLGRPCAEIRRGLRRIECESHVVFFEVDDSGIFILRVLHHSMIPEKHF